MVRSVHSVPAAAVDAEFERFAVRVYPLLLRTACALSGDHGHAEDLVQTTLLRVHRRWGDVERSPDGFAYRVLINLSRDRRRGLLRRPPETVLAGDRRELGWADGPAVAEFDRVLDRDAVTAAVVRLPRRMREVIVLRLLLDLSVAETAVALSTSDGTVKAYTARALARLRDLLSESDPAPGRTEEGPRAE